MASLPELLVEIANLEAAIVSHVEPVSETIDGEVTVSDAVTSTAPQLELYLQNLERDLEYKVDNYRFAIDRLASGADQLLAESDRIYKAAKALEAASTRIRERIKQTMLAHEKKELKGVNWRFSLSHAKKSAVDVDGSLVPKEFCTQVITYKPNRDEIREALNRGELVPGASLREVYTLRTNVNKKD